ncbi:hypothetical protein EDB81DRAFT_888190 [Dactylonectria macrodidyma]|uniref:Uncharacterized protein n=1 Tax=Dactylonectria macrodidyma TaxID=307937 RepID=A0A9P9ISK5_9HYPO|nr:hypothetical protein EDB81DRAFT_888190 [Dactylonectria macrodidyma]
MTDADASQGDGPDRLWKEYGALVQRDTSSWNRRERFKVGVGMASRTSTAEDELIEIDNRLIRLVDTPGFDDTNLTDTLVLEMIVTWMSVQ